MSDIDKWLKQVKKVFEDLPDGYEATIGYGSINVYLEGTLDDHLTDAQVNGWGIPREKEVDAIQFKAKVSPYSEGS